MKILGWLKQLAFSSVDYDFVAEVESYGEFRIEFTGTIIVDSKEYTNTCILKGNVKMHGNDITMLRFLGNTNIIKIHIERNSKQTDASKMFSMLKGLRTFTANPNTFGNVTNMSGTWSGCIVLTEMPLIDTSKVVNMSNAWAACHTIKTFPFINTSSVLDMTATWAFCEALTDFPLLNTYAVNSMRSAWRGCVSLIHFPNIYINDPIDVYDTWKDCTSLKRNLMDSMNVG